MYQKLNYIKPIKDPEHSFKVKSLKQAQQNF